MKYVACLLYAGRLSTVKRAVFSSMAELHQLVEERVKMETQTLLSSSGSVLLYVAALLVYFKVVFTGLER